ncbi:glycosyltransferase family 4 protein, partial [Candidatus Pelagibacter sp.]|nr:glycosyltransferase family 4 protein [Candidatus Pelagibacter sp.]
KKNNNLIILCVGFFSKIKNQKILYKSWKRISKKINCKLHFVGMKNLDYYLANNDEFNYILNDAKKSNLLHNIIFSEDIKNMADVYKSADIFVLPSLTEGMPNSVLEAMSTGLPSITSNLKFITTPLIKHGVNGFLFNAKNSYQLEKYLLMLLSSKKLRDKISANARHYILQNHSHKFFLQHKLMYEKLLS